MTPPSPSTPTRERPLLMADIDGVLSLFGAPAQALAGGGRPGEDRVRGSFHSIEGIPHFLSATAAAHLLELSRTFQLVWASGWEERANEHLPHLLGLPAGLDFLCFPRARGAGTSTRAHWKLQAIEQYAGQRALAWIDDAFNAACHAWAAARAAPTLLVGTAPERGLTGREARRLHAWAGTLRAPAR